MLAGKHNTLITVEQRQRTGTDPHYGTAIYGWVPLSPMFARVLDVLPTNAETLEDGVSLQNRPARVWVDFYDGMNITADMRISIEADAHRPARTMRIISGPALVEKTKEWQMTAEQLSTEGEAP